MNNDKLYIYLKLLIKDLRKIKKNCLKNLKKKKILQYSFFLYFFKNNN